MNFFLAALLGALVILVAAFLRGTKDKYPDFCVALGLAFFVLLLTIPNRVSEIWHPHTVDMLLYRADLALGLDSLAIARFVDRHDSLSWLLARMYEGLPIVVALAYAIERSRTLLRVCVVAPMIAFVCYNLVPAVGPAHAFSGYPWAISHLAVDPFAPRNCMPSMHFGWALLVLWNVQGRALKMFAYVFAGLTALATVGLGEHYYVDLLIAIPFCFLVQALSFPKKVESPDVEGVYELPSFADGGGLPSSHLSKYNTAPPMGSRIPTMLPLERRTRKAEM